MVRKVLFCILLIFLTLIEASICESLPRYFPVREIDGTQLHISYPYSSTNCICSKHRNFSFLQCEEKFLAERLISSNYKQYMFTKCNKTATSGDLNHDFSNLLGLNRLDVTGLDVTDCPEPSVSFVRQLFPPKNENFVISNREITINSHEEIENGIRYIKIKCLQRKEYAITKRHLENLSSLRSFNVSCLALKSLPWDLFQGTTPNLQRIWIEGTRIEEIPSMLFYNLTELSEVYLRGNFIKSIKGDAFLGCKNIFILDLNGNNLSYLGESVLKTLENVSRITLSNNRFRELPRNFSKMNRLIKLDISLNRLEELKKEDCDGLFNIRYLDISYNGITHIYPNCIPNNLFHLDISGNALQNITKYPTELNNLRHFLFRDNSVPQMDVKKFFVSKELFVIKMSNSNVFSLDTETFHGFPKLKYVDFGTNKIKAIPEDLFVKNEKLKEIYLRSNNISSLPSGLFRSNLELIHLDLSQNRITKLPKHVFSQNTSLETLNFAFNHIQNIPERFLANITSLKVLNFSNNHITSLHNDFLEQMTYLDQLDLSYNSLLYIQGEIFSSRNTSINLRRLFLQRNNLSEFPDFTLEKLEYLDISKNRLKITEENKFSLLNLYAPSLKELYLSKNNFEFIPLLKSFDNIENGNAFDSPFNKLSSKVTLDPYYLEKGALDTHKNINSIDLSYNQLSNFLLSWVSFANNLEKLNLSNNNIENIYVRDNKLISTKLKVLDICDNKLILKDSLNYFDESSLSWGVESLFRIFPHLEELHLRNNSISYIYHDWRIKMPYLKYLDLRHNKLQFLSHQDLLFKSTSFYESEGFGPYPGSHKLTIDLRHNLIRFIELPQRMLQILPQGIATKNEYGQVRMLIDDNPLECGCAVFNLLKVIRYDVVLTSQLRRVMGHTGMRSAKLVIGDLSCSSPNTVKGKKINNTEEWIHHLIPLFGICTLQDLL